MNSLANSLLPVPFLCILLSSASTLDNGPAWRLQLLHYAEDLEAFPGLTSLSASRSHFHISASDLLHWRRLNFTLKDSWGFVRQQRGRKGPDFGLYGEDIWGRFANIAAAYRVIHHLPDDILYGCLLGSEGIQTTQRLKSLSPAYLSRLISCHFAVKVCSQTMLPLSITGFEKEVKKNVFFP